MTDKSSEPSTPFPTAVLAALELAVLERRGGSYVLLGDPPAWLATSGSAALVRSDAPELHPFVAAFVAEAEAWWEAGGSGQLDSGVWCESSPAGSPVWFEARALRLSGAAPILVVKRRAEFATERHAPLQAAREALLWRERLVRETERKELLLHCIVHDLKGPLAGMLGTLSLLQSQPLSPDKTQQILELGISQARRQEGMIRGILEVFAMEVSALEEFETDAERAPDVLRCVREVAASYEPAFAQKRVELRMDVDGELPLPVVGHAQRLERVLANLLENGLRYAPPNSVVRVHLEPGGSSVRVSVEDRGPGVAPAVRGDLFEKFVRDPHSGGTGGLGLYFCRRNLELWGGRIGYEPREGGGSRFWIELRRA